jgi:hypothetical protein
MQLFYTKCARQDKQRVTMSIVKAVREIGGRFVDKDETGRWYDIGEQRAFDKVSQALRQGQPQLRDKLEQKQSRDVIPSYRTSLPETVTSTTSVPISAYLNGTSDYRAGDADVITTEVLKDLLRSSQTNSLHSMQSDMLQSDAWSNLIRDLDYTIPSVPRSSILSSFVVSDIEMLKNFNFLEETAELLEDSDYTRAAATASNTNVKRSLSFVLKSDSDMGYVPTNMEALDFGKSSINIGEQTAPKRARRGSVDDSLLDSLIQQAHRKKQLSCSFNDDTLFGLMSTAYEPVVRQESNDRRSRRLSMMLLDFADEMLAEHFGDDYNDD